MARAHRNIAVQSLRVGLLTLALTLQLVPVYFLLLVFAFYFGITNSNMLVMFPLALIATFIAACWLAAKRQDRRTQNTPAEPARSHPQPKPRRPVKDNAMFIKTREERFRDMVEMLKAGRR